MEMLPKPAFTTKEWPVPGARSTVRVMLIVKDDGTSSTSLQRYVGGDEWEHVKNSAIAHERTTEAEDRVEMLLQGGWQGLLQEGDEPNAPPAFSIA